MLNIDALTIPRQNLENKELPSLNPNLYLSNIKKFQQTFNNF